METEEKVKKYNVPVSYFNKLQLGEDFIYNSKIISNKDLTKSNSLPHSYAFCSDTRYNPELISKLTKIDLLYHETTFKDDLKERAFETGHSTTLEAATIAKKSKVKNLLIGHYSQRYKNLEELKEETQTIFLNKQLAYSGLTLDFKLLNKTVS